MKRQARFVEQLLREVHTPRERDVERRRAEVLKKEAPQMSCGHAEPAGELLDAVVVQSGGPCPAELHSGGPGPPELQSGGPCPPELQSGGPCPPEYAGSSLAAQRAVADHPQRARPDSRRTEPCGRARRRFGPAPQARPEPGGFGRRRGRKIPNVLVLRRTRRADWPAIDAGRRHGDEEAAIEPRVARSARAGADALIQIHLSAA